MWSAKVFILFGIVAVLADFTTGAKAGVKTKTTTTEASTDEKCKNFYNFISLKSLIHTISALQIQTKHFVASFNLFFNYFKSHLRRELTY